MRDADYRVSVIIVVILECVFNVTTRLAVCSQQLAGCG